MRVRSFPIVFMVVISLTLTSGYGDEPNINSMAADLIIPPVQSVEASPGNRVWATTTGWEGTAVKHTLYLPKGWKADGRYPVLIEYPGNGGYRNQLGDVSEGTVDGCQLGYGLSGGEKFIWACIPFVEITPEGTRQNCVRWWGDIEGTKRYCIATVREICSRYGGDSDRVVLCGFSRGSIACNYIGLRDDEIAPLWRAFFCHSHYDGVRKWPHADSDTASAMSRLKRLGKRPQWVSHEIRVSEIQQFVEQTKVTADIEFVALPFPNHTAAWLLRDIPERQAARDWLKRVTE